MMEHGLWVALVLAFLSLDQTAFGQFMVSRPIVTGPVVGWLLGRPDIGLELGALIELIWINDLPVGAHLPLDLTMLSGTTVALACELSKTSQPEAVMTFALGVAIPLALGSTEVEILLRKFHVRWLHFAQRMAFNGHLQTFEWINYLVLAQQWVKGFLVSLACLTLAHWSSHLYGILGQVLEGRVLEGFYYAHWLLLALGCSAVIDLLVERKNAPVLFLSIGAILTLAVFSTLPGIYLVAIALVAGFFLILYFASRGEGNR
ncbi:MAG TPA: PTS sugar transporter subunit IIC [bacterium]|nr:PTS sugar transporter subunit IIC [bacterium]